MNIGSSIMSGMGISLGSLEESTDCLFNIGEVDSAEVVSEKINKNVDIDTKFKRMETKEKYDKQKAIERFKLCNSLTDSATKPVNSIIDEYDNLTFTGKTIIPESAFGNVMDDQFEDIDDDEDTEMEFEGIDDDEDTEMEFEGIDDDEDTEMEFEGIDDVVEITQEITESQITSTAEAASQSEQVNNIESDTSLNQQPIDKQDESSDDKQFKDSSNNDTSAENSTSNEESEFEEDWNDEDTEGQQFEDDWNDEDTEGQQFEDDWNDEDTEGQQFEDDWNDEDTTGDSESEFEEDWDDDDSGDDSTGNIEQEFEDDLDDDDSDDGSTGNIEHEFEDDLDDETSECDSTDANKSTHEEVYACDSQFEDEFGDLNSMDQTGIKANDIQSIEVTETPKKKPIASKSDRLVQLNKPSAKKSSSSTNDTINKHSSIPNDTINATSKIKKNKISENKANMQKPKDHSTKEFDNLSEVKLYELVKKYLVLKKVNQNLVDIALLNRQFGESNIKKLIKKSYLIKLGDKVTIARGSGR